MFFSIFPLFSKYFTTFSISSNHCNFFRPFPLPFPGIIASDSHSQILGMLFFIPFPFPKIGNAFFSFPSRSRILGRDFFHSLPVLEIWEWIFLFPSPSWILGMGFFNSLPVPEVWELNFLFSFPFPNPQKSFPLTPVVNKCFSISNNNNLTNFWYGIFTR